MEVPSGHWDLGEKKHSPQVPQLLLQKQFSEDLGWQMQYRDEEEEYSEDAPLWPGGGGPASVWDDANLDIKESEWDEEYEEGNEDEDGDEANSDTESMPC